MDAQDSRPRSDVTAVVVTHNRPQELRQVIDGLLSQSVAPQTILVVDNASPLPAAQVLTGVLGVDVIRSEINTGGAGGFAFALRSALSQHCGWVWLMDDDAVPRPDALAALVAAAAELPAQAGALCSAVYEFGALAPTHRRSYGRWLGWERPLPARAYAGQSVPIDAGSFVGFMVRAQAARDVALPDAAFFLAYDDTEYSLRLQKSGWSVHLVPASGIDHLRTAESRLSTSTFGAKHFYNIRNRIYVARRYSRLGVPGAVLMGMAVWLVARSSLNMRALRLFGRAVADGYQGRLGKLDA